MVRLCRTLKNGPGSGVVAAQGGLRREAHHDGVPLSGQEEEPEVVCLHIDMNDNCQVMHACRMAMRSKHLSCAIADAK